MRLCLSGEMVDAHVSGACVETHKGSSPFSGMFSFLLILVKNLLKTLKFFKNLPISILQGYF